MHYVMYTTLTSHFLDLCQSGTLSSRRESAKFFSFELGLTLDSNPLRSRFNSSEIITLFSFLCSRKLLVHSLVSPNACVWRSEQL